MSFGTGDSGGIAGGAGKSGNTVGGGGGEYEMLQHAKHSGTGKGAAAAAGMNNAIGGRGRMMDVEDGRVREARG